jgi:DNA-binding HxlR family transcriptional regulator
MRSYRQACAIAKALDVVGDRWSLLIIRELLARGACRYTDLLDGLPGIATNLLADRLRQLETAGIVTRDPGARPVPVTLIRLTPGGEALRPVLLALARWGAPLLATADGDASQAHWLTFPAEAILTDRKPGKGRAVIEIRTEDELLTLEVDGVVHARTGRASRPHAVVSGPRAALVDLLTGRIDPSEAAAAGLTIGGDAKAVRRLRASADRRA